MKKKKELSNLRRILSNAIVNTILLDIAIIGIWIMIFALITSIFGYIK